MNEPTGNRPSPEVTKAPMTQPKTIADDCPCIQTHCPMHGNCVECVAAHRKGKHHVPECLQDQLRGAIAALAAQVELKTVENRPVPEEQQ